MTKVIIKQAIGGNFILQSVECIKIRTELTSIYCIRTTRFVGGCDNDLCSVLNVSSEKLIRSGESAESMIVSISPNL